MRRLSALLMLLLAAAFSVGAPAASFAASATQDAYDPEDDLAEETPDDEVVTAPETTQGAAPTPATTSSLPFTGLEAGLIGAAGFALAGVGITLRRTARANPQG